MVLGCIYPNGKMRPAVTGRHLNKNRYTDKILQQVAISYYSSLGLNCILRGKIFDPTEWVLLKIKISTEFESERMESSANSPELNFVEKLQDQLWCVEPIGCHLSGLKEEVVICKLPIYLVSPDFNHQIHQTPEAMTMTPMRWCQISHGFRKATDKQETMLPSKSDLILYMKKQGVGDKEGSGERVKFSNSIQFTSLVKRESSTSSVKLHSVTVRA